VRFWLWGGSTLGKLMDANEMGNKKGVTINHECMDIQGIECS
jgi:hypothetical protein